MEKVRFPSPCRAEAHSQRAAGIGEKESPRLPHFFTLMLETGTLWSSWKKYNQECCRLVDIFVDHPPERVIAMKVLV